MAKKKRQPNGSSNRLVFIGAFVPKTIKTAVEVYAANEGRTVSSTVRRILENTAGVKAALRGSGGAT